MRVSQYKTVSKHLENLSDDQLLTLLKEGISLQSGWGSTIKLEIEGVPIFVKQVPLNEIEEKSKNIKSTENLFNLPLYYQYGGFSVWRELAAHEMTTEWVLKDESQNYIGKIIYLARGDKFMKRYRSYKEHLIEKLKDSEYASAYLNACLEESFEAKDMGIFQLAVRDVVEANGGMAEISSKMEVSRESFYRSLSTKGKARFSTLVSAIRACGLEFEFHPAH